MNAQDIDSMPAGNKMDELVAEKVFGLTITHKKAEQWHVNESTYVMRPDGAVSDLPFYSTDIQAAWLIFERFFQDSSAMIGRCWTPHKEWAIFSPYDGCTVEESAETVPLLICRYALKAVLEKRF